jgi:hypothetical protein
VGGFVLMEVRIKSTPMSIDLTNTHIVQFAGNSIKFDMDVPEIRRVVAAHFEHCFGGDEKFIAEYQVRAEGEARFSIRCDGVDFQSNIQLDQVLQHLMQDGLTKLNGAASSDLIYHAAALSYQDRGLLLCGKSGSGKSTLTAWLVANGFQYLTDEVIALPFSGEEVRGFCRSLVLKRGSAFIWKRFLSNVETEKFFEFSDGSAWIAPTLFNQAAVREIVVPHLILFPTYSADADFKAERLTAANTLFHLMQCLVNARNFSDHGIERTKQLAQKTTAYRVIYSDIEQVSEWIRNTLTM